MLKPQDCVLLLKLIANPQKSWSQRELSAALCISLAEINKGIQRLLYSGLLMKGSSKGSVLPVFAAAEEFLVFGVKYSFPVKLGEYTPGIPTAVAAPVFKEHILLGEDPVPVWPYFKGTTQGLALQPLFDTVPQALDEHPDDEFYALLALVDAIRQGRARERNIAVNLLNKRLHHEK